MRRLFFCSVFILILSGCMVGTQPIISYSGDHPLSDTAVFVLRTEKGNDFGRILSVDDKETSCWQVGCPFWVRVIPGQHTFLVTYALFNNGTYSHLQGELTISPMEMKPRHIYEGRFQSNERGQTFRVDVTDLGERTDYSIDLGLEGVNQNNYKVTF